MLRTTARRVPAASVAITTTDVAAGGLSRAEAARRLQQYGPNQLRERPPLSRLEVIGRQFRSPLLLLLLFAAIASLATGAWVDASIVITIVGASAAIGYSREYRAETAVDALRSRLHVHVQVLRDGQPTTVPLEDVVPGDVTLMAAGCLVPGDGTILDATDFFVSEAALTGESFPVEKRAGDAVYLGTNVRAGTARCAILQTGRTTAFGSIAHQLTATPPDTEFERGLRRFGSMLVITMLTMALLVFVTHVLGGRPSSETLLFSIALAVGLSPELLPAILTVNLARGAGVMAEHGVLVRRLNAIENLGSVDVLCTDKTGTLTEGLVRLEGAYDVHGTASDDALHMAALNAALATGLPNPLDAAIRDARTPSLTAHRKIVEIPFDAVRKRVSVVIADTASRHVLITKGAFNTVLEACTRVTDGPLDPETMRALRGRYDAWSRRGIRVVAVATRTLDADDSHSRDDEQGMTLVGFLTFVDRPKEGAADALRALHDLGVAVKVISGDSRPVAEYVAEAVALPGRRVITGAELRHVDADALWRVVEDTDIFAEVDPNQKERIILALKKAGHVVAFLGDGVNDVSAMHSADTSLAVDDAVDVARQAADFVLLERGLAVIQRGIEEGRRTFANTLKYVLMTTSANLGNMVSMAAISLLLPYLPLLAGQILLNNFLSDVPAIGIADDRVDRAMTEQPHRWDVVFIARYMLRFGLISSAFDFLTFGVLLIGFHGSMTVFRTAWFVESLLTELIVALIVRTTGPCYRSRPGTVLLATTATMVPLAVAIPYLPGTWFFGFTPLTAPVLGTVVGITALYAGTIEIAKRRLAWATGFGPHSPGALSEHTSPAPVLLASHDRGGRRESFARQHRV